MGLMTWLALALVGLLGGVALALARCAVAELVLRVAARIYTADGALRRERREEWLRIVQDMKPQERPAHAASLLWMALAHLPERRRVPGAVVALAAAGAPGLWLGGEDVEVVTVLPSEVLDTKSRRALGLGPSERAILRSVVLRGLESGATVSYAESIVILDRVSESLAYDVLTGEQYLMELLTESQGHEEIVYSCLGPGLLDPHIGKIFQLSKFGKPVAWIVQSLPD